MTKEEFRKIVYKICTKYEPQFTDEIDALYNELPRAMAEEEMYKKVVETEKQAQEIVGLKSENENLKKELADIGVEKHGLELLKTSFNWDHTRHCAINAIHHESKCTCGGSIIGRLVIAERQVKKLKEVSECPPDCTMEHWIKMLVDWWHIEHEAEQPPTEGELPKAMSEEEIENTLLGATEGHLKYVVSGQIHNFIELGCAAKVLARRIINQNELVEKQAEEIEKLKSENDALHKPETDEEAIAAFTEAVAVALEKSEKNNTYNRLASAIRESRQGYVLWDTILEAAKPFIHAPVKRLALQEMMQIASEECPRLYNVTFAKAIRAIHAAIYGEPKHEQPTVEECAKSLREHMKPWPRLETEYVKKVARLLDAIEREKGGE